jgi:hypothetical protein
MITDEALARLSRCALAHGIPNQPGVRHAAGEHREAHRRHTGRGGRIGLVEVVSRDPGALPYIFRRLRLGGPSTSPLKGKGHIRGPQVVSWS